MTFTTNSINTFKSLTAENILSIVPEEEIYKYYLGFDFEIGRCYNSVLRKDSTPSLNFYYNRAGKLCYKDFGHSQGNVFEFVKNLYDCTYFEAIERVNYDFKLNLGKNVTEVASDRPIYNIDVKKKTRATLIQVAKKEFSEFDIKYWNSYGISLDTLKLFNVIAVKYVWLNKKLRFIYTESDPIYAFLFGDKIKVYRPFSTLKWLNNATSEILQGLDLLPEKGERLIITKSMKDVMLFFEYKMPSIAPQGESMEFSFDEIEKLKKRFDKIIVIYDNDEPGVRFSTKLTSTLGLNYWNIPKHYIEKDPTDFYHKYGKKETTKLLNTIN